MNLQKFITHSLFLVIGLVLGIVIMGYLSMKASQVYIEVFRINYEQEQEMLAAHARRDGKLHWELAHRKNVVDISSPDGLRALDDTKATWEFDFPFAVPILEAIGDIPNRERALRINKGVKLARLADTLDRLGMENEAALKWREAAQLMGHNDIAKAKALIPMWHDIEEKWLEIEENFKSAKE